MFQWLTSTGVTVIFGDRTAGLDVTEAGDLSAEARVLGKGEPESAFDFATPRLILALGAGVDGFELGVSDKADL